MGLEMLCGTMTAVKISASSAIRRPSARPVFCKSGAARRRPQRLKRSWNWDLRKWFSPVAIGVGEFKIADHPRQARRKKAFPITDGAVVGGYFYDRPVIVGCNDGCLNIRNAHISSKCEGGIFENKIFLSVHGTADRRQRSFTS